MFLFLYWHQLLYALSTTCFGEMWLTSDVVVSSLSGSSISEGKPTPFRGFWRPAAVLSWVMTTASSCTMAECFAPFRGHKSQGLIYSASSEAAEGALALSAFCKQVLLRRLSFRRTWSDTCAGMSIASVAPLMGSFTEKNLQHVSYSQRESSYLGTIKLLSFNIHSMIVKLFKYYWFISQLKLYFTN